MALRSVVCTTLVLLLSAGCRSFPAQSDGSAPTDVEPIAPDNHVVGKDAGKDATKDASKDVGPQGPCDEECSATSERLCVRHPSQAGCVECLTNDDCLNNPGSLGVTCDSQRNLCTCSGDDDCLTNLNGTRCDPDTSRCGCGGDSECLNNRKCSVDGDKACHDPCSSDDECVSQTQGRQNKCDTTWKLCVECTESADCASHRNGSSCKGGQCTCSSNADCTGGYRYGNACTSDNSCRCVNDTDCVGNARGPKCSSVGACTCETDDQCKTAPYSRCLPHLASSSMCQRPCATSLDCLRDHQVYLARCDDSTKQCVQCLTNSDCASSYRKLCQTSEHRCVACETNAHCTHPQHPACYKSEGRCVECQVDADCAGQANRHICQKEPGKCVLCLDNADCAQHLDGKKCTNAFSYQECTCYSDADCRGADSYGYEFRNGNVCLDLGANLSDSCGCRSPADCANNRHGPNCHAGKPGGGCICYSDSECTKAPYTLCSYYGGSIHKKCRKPCKSDDDCHEGWMFLCVAATQRCGECRTDTDCPPHSSVPFATVCDADHRCTYPE